MKKILTILLLTFLLAACAPPSEIIPPTPQSIPDVEGTALALIEANRPTPQPIPEIPTEVVIPMFNIGDAQVFFRDTDATDRFDVVQAFYQNRTVTFWAEEYEGALADMDGEVRLVPNLIQDQFRFGGIGTKTVCSARFINQANQGISGTGYWIGNGPDGRDAIIVRFTGRNMRGYTGDNDWPFDFASGITLHVTCPVP